MRFLLARDDWYACGTVADRITIMTLMLLDDPALAPTRDDGVVLARGKANDPAAVRALQTALSAFGLGLGVDGIYGFRTEAAVAAYQADVGLPIDGRFGPHTLYSLAEALRSHAHHGDDTGDQPLPGLWCGDRFGARVALTFDDGPHHELTPQVLDILNEAGIKGCFFMVGRRVAAQPALVRRVVAEGHGLGNHSWDHQDYGVLTAGEVRDQLQRTEDAILDALGAPWPGPKLARPPYGSPFFDAQPERKERVGQVLRELHYGCVLWTIDTRDWAHPNDADAVVDETLRQLPAAQGGVVLMHDVHKQSIAALPRIVAALPERNLSTVTLGHLWEDKYPVIA